jgi:hypothetical protein
MSVNTNDTDRLKAEIRYLRNCLLEAYNALPTLPCTSLDSYSVASPIMRGIRDYHTSYDAEFEPSKVAKKRRRVSACLSVSAEDRPDFLDTYVDDKPVAPQPFAMPKKAESTARSLGFDLDLS